eukprot:gnl/Spiro4/18003_TR9608_c0_g1_i2.p2 gnl/Spiro4/18003_TR9608_c0_g1~~gnl/Spiro4/18003_TR9608_c0_g1_i2.p2  ORF type:complete len:141 (-),score=36.16 gnl/Spiro4/18003_TR9608_c0_g1_i2:59-430(-)
MRVALYLLLITLTFALATQDTPSLPPASCLAIGMRCVSDSNCCTASCAQNLCAEAAANTTPQQIVEALAAPQKQGLLAVGKPEVDSVKGLPNDKFSGTILLDENKIESRGVFGRAVDALKKLF